MSSVEITVADTAAEAARLVAERLVEQARDGGSILPTGASPPRHEYQISAEL
jgi:hypothetical protein